MNGVTVTFDKAAVMTRVHAAAAEATYAITDQFIKDANVFCRKQSGDLADSALLESQPENGLAMWGGPSAPYARRMYYTGTPRINRNPNASTLWGERAKRANTKKYQRMAQAIADRRV